jgi:hypothetical protein
MADNVPTCSEFSIEIPAPKDAEGRNVPLDTKVMYKANGEEFKVRWFTYSTCPYGPGWSAKVYDPSDTIALDFLHLEKPDSLKQLAEDLNRMVNFKRGYGYSSSSCAYTGISGSTCDCCKFKDSSDMCSFAVIKDIAARVNRLCGDSE